MYRYHAMLLLKIVRENVKILTACGHRIAHRKWKESKLQPGTAGPGNRLGCCLISFRFLWAILCPQAVYQMNKKKGSSCLVLSCNLCNFRPYSQHPIIGKALSCIVSISRTKYCRIGSDSYEPPLSSSH